PVRRPGAKDLVERTEALSVALNIDLSKPVINVDTPLLKRIPGRSSSAAPNAAPPRPPPPRSAVAEEVTEQASAMLGALKGQGLSLLKNLREKSSAVVQKVQVWESEGCKRSLTISKSLSSELDVGDVLLDGQVTLLMSYSRSDQSDTTSKVWESEGCKRSLTISKSLSSELDVGDVLLDGQVTLLMSYSRSDPSDTTSKKFMFSVVFHTSTAEELMKFARSDIDISAVEENNIPPDFRSVSFLFISFYKLLLSHFVLCALRE
ncbi:unnamed protein product, partial [Cylicostephanus goldi]